MEKIKLQKYFTDCGVLSRRAAEKEIADGKVKVNGVLATLGLRIDPDTDTVEYNGKLLKPQTEERFCVMLNKPAGYVTTLSDEKGRRTVTELVSDAGARLYPIGRLDMNSDGLLLLTNDGELANRLTHPRHEIPKIYRVTVKGEVSEKALAILSSPLVIDGYKIRPVKTEIIYKNKEKGPTLLEMELYEGRNRQIRKMCEAADLKVLRLMRVAYGELELGTLPSGRWRRLTRKELEYLSGSRDSLKNKE
jgi:23S rRNA pseudouridine2605 synthase